MDESNIKPIIEIRTFNDKIKQLLFNDIFSLVKRATLDKNQLISFLDSIRNGLHLTQGPPGTGKSYLGVLIVRAL